MKKMNMDRKELDEDVNKNIDTVPCLCSKRWIMGYMGILLGVFLYLLRVDFSMAMVCMVKTPVQDNINATNTTVWLYKADDTAASGNYSLSEEVRGNDKCGNNQQAIADDNENAEFVWSKTFQSLLLSVYYVGCFISQVPGGWLAHRFGGKRLVTVTMLMSALLTLLTPVLIRANAYIVLAVRLIMGICSGGVIPAWFDLVGVWVPPFERSRFTAFCWIGQVSGAILAYATSGVLCAHAPDNGWPFIFYVHGAATVVFVVGWQLIVADRPVKHRRISEAELSYIKKFVSNKTKEESRDVPWKAIFTSRCVWAIYISHICDAWTFFTLLICLPMFLNDVMKLDIQKNGLYSSLPYVTFAISLFLSGHTADCLLAKRILTTTATRRTFQAIAFSGAAVSICLSGFVTCSQRDLVILYICLCNFFVGMGEASGYSPNPVDIAPKYAAIIFSVSNTMAQIPGFVAPTIVGALTPNGTSEEWRNVFYICTVLNILGIIVFSSMSTGEVQPWSRTTIELIIAPGIKDTESQTKHDQNYGLNDDSKDKDGVEDVLIERKALLMRNIEYS